HPRACCRSWIYLSSPDGDWFLPNNLSKSRIRGLERGQTERFQKLGEVCQRFSLRQTKRRPDQTSLTAQTLLSTKPWGRPMSRRRFSSRSVATRADRLGQAIHRLPSGKTDLARPGKRRSRSRARVVNRRTTAGLPPALRRSCTPSGR